MLSIDQVQSFAQVYQHGSYSEAARAVGKKRSTIREHVKTLEETIGVDLFIVEGRKVKPTVDADKLISRARNLSKQAEDFSLTAMSLYDKPLDKLWICCDPLVPPSLVRDALKIIRMKYPHMLIDVSLSSAKEAYNVMESKLCHIAIMATQNIPQTAARIGSRYIGTLQISGYCGSASELLNGEVITLDDLRLVRQYQFDKTRMGDLGGLAFSNKIEKVGSFELAIELLAEDGWMMLSKHMATPWVDAGVLSRLNVDDVARDHKQGVTVFYGLSAAKVNEVRDSLDAIEACSGKYLD